MLFKISERKLNFCRYRRNCFKQPARVSPTAATQKLKNCETRKGMRCSWWLQFMVCWPAHQSPSPPAPLFMGFGLAWRRHSGALRFSFAFYHTQTAFLKPSRFAAEQRKSRSKWLTGEHGQSAGGKPRKIKPVRPTSRMRNVRPIISVNNMV